jgi:hypothetical protein
MTAKTSGAAPSFTPRAKKAIGRDSGLSALAGYRFVRRRREAKSQRTVIQNRFWRGWPVPTSMTFSNRWPTKLEVHGKLSARISHQERGMVDGDGAR